MNDASSSCEIGQQPAAGPHSRLLRFQPGFRWDGVPVAEYKQAAENWCGVRRMTLAGGQGESAAFEVRYFEIEPGGFSSLEHHAHVHVVIVLRGQGQVTLGEELHGLGFGDTVYVAAHAVHQFRNPSGKEPFGFLCVVDAVRDRPAGVTR
jgi:S-methyl-1-thioxylulose 5-phosphate methylthiotransferase